MLLHELEAAALALPEHEQRRLVDAITSRWTPGIERTPGVVGGQARIAGTRIPVWLLVEARQLGITDEELLEDYPRLTRQDLTHAWNYAERNAHEIDCAIAENEGGAKAYGALNR